MVSGLTTPTIAISAFLILLAASLPWTGWLGPFPPSPDLVIRVDGQELYPAVHPGTVTVKTGQPVQVKVEAYYQGELINAGEFNYQWCFDPPVNNNPHCADAFFKGDTNNDYKPENGIKQTLKITVGHDFFKTSTIALAFEPE
jgi:hypothetical protein